MKIIQNNYRLQESAQESVSEEYICEECNSVFEYDGYDVTIDADNVESVTCPCCGHRCITYTPTTKENIEFPKRFYQFGVSEGSVNITNSEITRTIRNTIEWLEKHPNEPFRYSGSGDTFICVYNHLTEYYVIVAKNYFDTTIDK